MKINHPVTDHEVLMKEGTILVTKTDLKGRIIFANDAFVDISGFSREELVGANHNVVRHPDMPAEAFEDLWLTIKKGYPWCNLVKNRTKNGDYYWVEAHVSAVYEKGQLSHYMSCRYAPSREQVRSAEALYEQIRNKKAKLKSVGLMDKINPLKRFGLAGKMASLAAMLLLPTLILFGLFINEKNANIEFAAKEIKGLEYLQPLKQLAEQIAEHRSTVDSYFSANNGANGSVTQIGKQVDSAINTVDKTVELSYGAEFNTAEPWSALKQNWVALEKQGLQASRETSFAEHGKLLEQINGFMAHISDQSNLTLDPDVDSYYLMSVVSFRLPKLIDHINELRAVSTRIAKRGGVLDVPSKIRLALLDQLINDRFAEVETDLAAAYEKNPELKLLIGDSQQKFAEDVKAFTGTVKQGIYDSETVSVSIEQLFSTSTEALRSLDNLYEKISPSLKGLLEQRIAGVEQSKLYQSLSVVLFMIVLGFVGYRIIRDLISSIQHTVNTLLKITDGQFRNTLELERVDEIGGLWRGLESMQVAMNVEISNTREIATKALRVERALENVSSSVMLANNNLEIIFMNKSVQDLFKNAEEDIRRQLPNFDSSKLMGANIDQFHKNPAHQRNLLAKLDSVFSSSLEVGGRHMNIVANPVKDADGSRVGVVVEWLDRTREVKIEQEIESIVESVKAGRLDQRLSLADKQGFFAKLSEGINELTDVIERAFADIGSTMESMAEGDLTNRITSDYQGVYLTCKNDINATIDKLSEIFGQVNESAIFINNSSQEIASGNNNLSQRAEQQAANLEQTAASMEQLTSTVKNNADNAQQANQVASNARELAEKGGNVVTAAVAAMQEINESSNKIADIIGVIDEIAFQTNLLALNASVEAARAGEQGRGFSVVATEVRNLAQRSATAARESKELIQNSVQKVRAGSEFVNQTGTALSEIVTGVKRVGDIVAAIANASVEQSAGIAQVNQAVSQMDEITQQNAALAEQASAASVSMSDLSTNMVELLSFFRLENQSTQAAPVANRSAPSIARATEVSKKVAPIPQPSYKSVASDEEWQDF